MDFDLLLNFGMFLLSIAAVYYATKADSHIRDQVIALRDIKKAIEALKRYNQAEIEKSEINQSIEESFLIDNSDPFLLNPLHDPEELNS